MPEELSVTDRKIAALEERLAALEGHTNKEPEIRCLRVDWVGDSAATYTIMEPNCGYDPGAVRNFTMREILIALAKKVGLKIVYHYPTSARVEYK